METIRIAVPSETPGGMEAGLGMHFGHCDLYTIADVKDGEIVSVSTLESVPHVQGGCMAPVRHLSSNGVKVLLAGGMGMRPLMGFQQEGVAVYFAGIYASVGQAVQAFLDGKLQPFDVANTCGGGK